MHTYSIQEQTNGQKMRLLDHFQWLKSKLYSIYNSIKLFVFKLPYIQKKRKNLLRVNDYFLVHFVDRGWIYS